MYVINRTKIRALKDKWIAGAMMLREDYVGARKKLLDAQLLHPELDNMDLMLAICEILILDSNIKLLDSETGINVLLKHFTPSATDFEAKNYFQNLLTSMYSIRDEFPGTNLAMELLQTAFLMIKDREKHVQYEVSQEAQETSLNDGSSSQVLDGEEGAFRSDESTNVEVERPSLPNDIDTQDTLQTSWKNPRAKLAEQPAGAIDIESFVKDEALKSNWCSDDFVIGQIWAVYWGKGSLPRQYTQIVAIISDSQVYVTLLEPLATLGHEIDWRQEKLSIACGTFKTNDIRLNLEMSQFSHPVKCQQIICGSFFRIFPLKGEIWATYRNWNCKWKKTDRDSCQYQIVQIVSDYAEGDEIRVTRLQEVMGCLTLFERNQLEGFYLTRRVSKSDMLSFSHQIPAYRVSGSARYGIPEICWHLEPKAIPHK